MKRNCMARYFAWHCLPDDEPSGYTYEGGSSRLVRFSGLSRNSTDVYVRAGIIVWVSSIVRFRQLA